MNHTQRDISPLNGLTVYVVGSNRLFSELIASCLERETGAECHIKDHLYPLDIQKEDGQPSLILLDSHGKDPENLLAELESLNNLAFAGHQLILFNVSPDLGIEEKCVWEGVQGFFYEKDPVDRFVTGITAVLNGDMWVPRKIMKKCIWQGRSVINSIKHDSRILTRRENEIMALLATGVSNEDMAEKLCISLYTVKTHLYNIFKKIDVDNRLQAVLWAGKNMAQEEAQRPP
jgi:DNA-binding NarL/FixJ family response regulator